MTKLTPSTQFINVLVQVEQGAGPGQYVVQTFPEVPYVTQADTVLNYQICQTGGQNIVFTGMTVKPAENDQLSTPSISISGKNLTFCDANTSEITLNITFHFEDEEGKKFMHDPQVENQPEQ